ncbi:hypothetical protein PGT21_000898 [Puccinia graminis f. sp. tritici]|uniref:Uncharacterized protein n=1 Tax=Puccinia graminis f. sp. tritici TaxID=56615 RepID=A0A5B0QRP5_PUCGR|nr:hypothetical protein PGT21_022575 [Puccinia graminis f. sp. tritici]KAA1115829.1 hypothetical protein PGT21_000809 [Puccinia graminis f. sp. tritici]KAA1115834.1 hypothetical protein PGT21_000898 [Puccinia graminis f. sp. tritici]
MSHRNVSSRRSPQASLNHRLNHRRSPSAGTVRRPSTRAQSSPRTHNNRSNISIGDGRFNPMRGVQNTSQGTNVRGATSQEVPSGYANIFEQEQGPRLDHSGSELGSGDDHIDEEGPSDEENLYAVWPPLRPAGTAVTGNDELKGLIELDENHLQLVHRLLPVRIEPF